MKVIISKIALSAREEAKALRVNNQICLFLENFLDSKLGLYV